MRRNSFRRSEALPSNCPSDSIQLGLLQARSIYPPAQYGVELLQLGHDPAKRAHDEDWPEDAWKSWRYRRATLARLLAREGMMQQVADAYETALAQFAPRPPTTWERMTSALR